METYFILPAICVSFTYVNCYHVEIFSEGLESVRLQAAILLFLGMHLT